MEARTREVLVGMKSEDARVRTLESLDRIEVRELSEVS